MPWFTSSKKKSTTATLAKAGKQAFKDVVHHGSQNIGEIRQPSPPWKSLSLTDGHQPILMPREKIILTSDKCWPKATYAHDKELSIECTAFLTNRRVLSVEYGKKLAKSFGQYIMISDVTALKDDRGGVWTTSYKFEFTVGKSQKVVMKIKRADADSVLKSWLKEFSVQIKACQDAEQAVAAKRKAQETAAAKVARDAAAKKAFDVSAAKKVAEDAAAKKTAEDAAAKRTVVAAAAKKAADAKAAAKKTAEDAAVKETVDEKATGNAAAEKAVEKAEEDAAKEKVQAATKAADMATLAIPMAPHAAESKDEVVAAADGKTINALLDHISGADFVEAGTAGGQMQMVDAKVDASTAPSYRIHRPPSPPREDAQAEAAAPRAAPGPAEKEFLLTFSKMTGEQQKAKIDRIKRRRSSMIKEQRAEYEAFKNHKKGERIAVPHKGEPSPDGEVVLLVTSLRYNVQVHADCNGLRELLERNSIQFIEIDGTEPDNIHERTRLFTLSGKRGLYPQLFCGSTFIGGAYEIMEMDEEGTLRNELGMDDDDDDDDDDEDS